MFELSASIAYLFSEAGADLAARVALAADCGIRKVEAFTISEPEVRQLAPALAQHGVELWTVVADPRTRLVDPQTHSGFRASFRRTAEHAATLGCRRIVVGSGPAVPYQKRAAQLATVTAAIAGIVDTATEFDMTVLIEAVNTRHDHPGVLFSMTDDAAAVVRGVGSPRVRLLYDLYHSITEGEDPAVVLPQVIDLVAHVQIADVPGRGEPGSGTLDWPQYLDLLRRTGYRGVLGVECHPTKAPTAAALAYIQRLCA
ncbi:MAG: TIM barrel protein [Steroidobacteraceae bacterium]|nr:TIM barrel protein [Steroidobacteraceae bacterium]